MSLLGPKGLPFLFVSANKFFSYHGALFYQYLWLGESVSFTDMLEAKNIMYIIGR